MDSIRYEQTEMEDYRQTIDYLDTSLLFLLAERWHVIRKISAIKTKRHLSAQYSPKRKADLEKTTRFALKKHISKVFLDDLFACIFKHAKQSMQHTTPSSGLITSETLAALRQSLFNLDSALCVILAERFHTSLKIAEYKFRNSMPLLDSQRWKTLMQVKLNMAEKLGVSTVLVEDIFNIIHKESLRLQTLHTNQ